VTVLVACALGACGDEADDPRSKDEKQIRAVLNELLTTKDPDSCVRIATLRYLEQSTARRGLAAIRSCRKNARNNRNAELISIGRVAVSGPRASADLRQEGSSLFFKQLRVGLRKPAGRWKLDRTKSATLDRPAFFRFARKEVTSPPDALSRRAAECVLRRLKSIESRTIVRALLKVDLRLFLIPGAICGLRDAFAGSDVPQSVVVCIQRRLRRELTSGVTGRRVAANPGRLNAILDSPRRKRAGRRILKSCVHR